MNIKQTDLNSKPKPGNLYRFKQPKSCAIFFAPSLYSLINGLFNNKEKQYKSLIKDIEICTGIIDNKTPILYVGNIKYCSQQQQQSQCNSSKKNKQQYYIFQHFKDAIPCYIILTLDNLDLEIVLT